MTKTLQAVLRLSLLAAVGAGLSGCGDDGDPAGGGGSGGDENGGSPTLGGNVATGGGGAGGGGAPPDSVCGDGVREGEEQCDGSDLGDSTCESIGLGPGELACAVGCGLVTSGCAAAEICWDHLDNNLDGLIDCSDPGCASGASCVSGCAQAQPIFISDQTIGDYEFHGSTLGKPAGLEPSCAADSGAEEVVTFVAPSTGKFSVLIGRWGSDSDLSLSIRTDCGDDASEIACLDRPNVFPAADTEHLIFDAVEGSTYFVIVDVRASSPETLFFLYVVPVTADTFGMEATSCADGVDNDANGESDCNDAVCAADPACISGAAPFGAACNLATDCASPDGRPVCTSAFTAALAGYCSAFCDPDAPDCAAGDYCSPLGGDQGICLDGCTADSDCLPGWGCREVGAPVMLCKRLESDCTINTYDTDGDGLEDCSDADCVGTPACAPGTAVAGAACTENTDCAATGGDPLCMNGNCTEVCDPTDPSSCGPDALCIGHTFLGFLCYQKCDASPDCPDPDDGYCVDLPPGYGYGGVCNLPG